MPRPDLIDRFNAIPDRVLYPAAIAIGAAMIAGMQVVVWVADRYHAAEVPTAAQTPGALRLLSGFAMLVVIMAAVVAIYFAPIIVAARRGHPNTAAIAVLNVLLGFTVVGYAVALAWAFTAFDEGAKS